MKNLELPQPVPGRIETVVYDRSRQGYVLQDEEGDTLTLGPNLLDAVATLLRERDRAFDMGRQAGRLQLQGELRALLGAPSGYAVESLQERMEEGHG